MKLIYLLTGSLFLMSLNYYSEKKTIIECSKLFVSFNHDTLKIELSWKKDRIIVGKVENPVGLIGVYYKQLPKGILISDTKQAVDFTCFPITDSTNFKLVSVNGFKLLNTESSLYRSADKYWNHFNKPWLESLVLNKATVYVLSDIKNDLLKYGFNFSTDSTLSNYKYNLENFQLNRTGFGKEIEYMDSIVKFGIYYWDEQIGAYKAK